MVVEIIIILLLIIVNGIFSMSEIALVSSKKFKLESASEKGNKGAKVALDLSENPGKFLSTVQVGITLIGILTGVFGGASISRRLDDYFEASGVFGNYSETVAGLIVVFGITYVTLILGELLPKRIGMNSPEKIASAIAIPMTILAKIVKPLIWLLSASTDLFIKILQLKPQEDHFVTEEEIKAMLEEASDIGEVEKEEREMVERVFFLGDTDVGSLMSSRADVVSLDINEDLEVNKKIMAESIHTHFPVYENEYDNIIGILSLKTFSSSLLKKEEIDLRSMLIDALFVPVQMTAFKLLENMKARNTHFAVAVDEYGSVKGVITTNDLVNVVIGDVYRKEEAEIIKRQDDSYLVDGLISLDEFFRYFEVEKTEEIEKEGFYTLGGLILYIFKRIPSSGETIDWKNLHFEVLDMDGQRVDKVLVRPLDSR